MFLEHERPPRFIGSPLPLVPQRLARAGAGGDVLLLRGGGGLSLARGLPLRPLPQEEAEHLQGALGRRGNGLHRSQAELRAGETRQHEPEGAGGVHEQPGDAVEPGAEFPGVPGDEGG